VKFVSNHAAAVLGKVLVVADLHLGIEFDLRSKGVRMPLQWKATAAELSGLLKQTRCSELLILGDAKHDIYGMELREKEMMRSFFRSVLDFGCKKITVVKGNHDGQLQELKEEGFIELVGPSGGVFSVGGRKYGACHGHAWPSEEVAQARVLLLAHSHPLIEFRDSLGFRWFERAWILGSLRRRESRGCQKAVVFPAFNTLSGGLAFNSRPCRGLFGPLFENNLFELESAEARVCWECLWEASACSESSSGAVSFFRKLGLVWRFLFSWLTPRIVLLRLI